MKIRARNVLPATVKAVTPGAVDTEVVVELAPGIEIVFHHHPKIRGESRSSSPARRPMASSRRPTS
jgi:hypothetical protein